MTNFCKDCAHVQVDTTSISPEHNIKHYLCTAYREPVAGNPIDCSTVRAVNGQCNVEGLYWKEKENSNAK